MAVDDVVALSDKTNVGMPVRNLIGLIGAVCVGAWGYFGVLERLNKVETLKDKVAQMKFTNGVAH